MSSGNVRPPTHANQNWYKLSPTGLARELEENLGNVPDTIDGAKLPIPGARMVISPHAGYEHSGQCAAWAFKALDLSKAKRVFILGPSHKYALHNCAISQFDEWATPLGNLKLDQAVLREFQEAGDVDDMPLVRDKNEHSMEMQAPYLYKRFQQTFADPEHFPTIVPILVGSPRRKEEKEFGQMLLPYLRDPENAFVISSDFCHWGGFYGYTVYAPDNDPSKLIRLRKNDPAPAGLPIYKTIELIDQHAMDAVESGSHDAFLDSLRLTNNSVCGRHPIGMAMAGLELLRQESDYHDKACFKVLQYHRSNQVEDPSDFSVSYVSAYAVL